MNLISVLAEAFVSLNKNKIRTGLSVLGIVIGVGAVIAMVAVGEGARQKVEAEIKSLGDDWIMVMYWGVQRGGSRKQSSLPQNLTREDSEAVLRDCSSVRAATPVNRMGMQAQSSYGNYQTSVLGSYPDYFDIRRWEVSAGRAFTTEEMNMRGKVCVLGQTVVRELFGAVDPVGETIRVNKVAFEVIGVLDAKGVGSDGRDNDDCIVFPYFSFTRYIAGKETSGTMMAASKHDVPLALAKNEIRSLLRQRHRLADEEDDDFRIFDRSLTAQASAESTNTFNTLLAAIASISLLVGGVGIMNIMLVSVTERTREIGLRMAIGANGLQILGQFLFEAIVLCAIGGLLGFGGGWAAAKIIEHQNGWAIAISYWMAAMAVAFASGVGLFFGFYPAWRASKLDPIEALRFE